MKITKEHCDYIRAAICNSGKALYLQDYIKRGLSEKRWRWDCLWAAGISQWISDNIYTYANDEHIDTALNFILKSK